jgi:hypothetical protein
MTTKFTPRGKLSGVLRERPSRQAAPGRNEPQPPQADTQPAELDTQAYEALYYRARLVLGEALPRPARFQLRGIGGD